MRLYPAIPFFNKRFNVIQSSIGSARFNKLKGVPHE